MERGDVCQVGNRSECVFYRQMLPSCLTFLLSTKKSVCVLFRRTRCLLTLRSWASLRRKSGSWKTSSIMNPDGEKSNSSLRLAFLRFCASLLFPSTEQVVERRDAEPEAERHRRRDRCQTSARGEAESWSPREEGEGAAVGDEGETDRLLQNVISDGATVFP